MTAKKVTKTKKTTKSKNTESVKKPQLKKEKQEIKKEDIIAEKEKQIKDLDDKYTRLYAEFDNYRRRTSKEKIELISSASEKIIIELLPTLDDFERAIKATEEAKGDKEGLELIFNKLKKSLEKEGLKEIDAIGKELDTDYHEAITQIPAPQKELKGKIVDTIEKGYFLNEKVIRFAKVVVGI